MHPVLSWAWGWCDHANDRSGAVVLLFWSSSVHTKRGQSRLPTQLVWVPWDNLYNTSVMISYNVTHYVLHFFIFRPPYLSDISSLKFAGHVLVGNHTHGVVGGSSFTRPWRGVPVIFASFSPCPVNELVSFSRRTHQTWTWGTSSGCTCAAWTSLTICSSSLTVPCIMSSQETSSLEPHDCSQQKTPHL